ncbi:hypothetical protein [Desulfotomaculum nigrificans]|uniref:hypothetical protein n=1 Tax=Desulfotomaculum nigrificans TaxID=1565 RepID=UPI0002E6AF2B|nr:hypothetical protein [Desulfotomaculum nigrificans]
MKKSSSNTISRRPVISLTVCYSQDGAGLNDAYKLLAKKVMERRLAVCGRRSISG